ncbi:MAG: hypothetical protein KOO62_10975 [candidate division Zixibacteria bacterium]|nr:hypothetical protein [candidate division Zixibacteria bacterium]
MKTRYVGFILLVVLCLLCWGVLSSCSAGDDPRLRIEYVDYRNNQLFFEKDHIDVYETLSDSSYTARRDYWDERRSIHCGCTTVAVGGSPRDRERWFNNTSNSIVNDLFKTYWIDKDLVDKFGYDPNSIRPDMYTCYPPKGLTGLSYHLSHNSRGESIDFFCIFDEVRDSLIFVDSITSCGRDDFSQFLFFVYTGENAYYRKRESTLRFNILSEVIDTIPHGTHPIIPQNSSELLVYDKPERKLKLLDDQLHVRAWIEVKLVAVQTIYSLGDDVFVIGNLAARPGRESSVMQLVYYDFKDGDVHLLYDARIGQILNVERVP